MTLNIEKAIVLLLRAAWKTHGDVLERESYHDLLYEDLLRDLEGCYEEEFDCDYFREVLKSIELVPPMNKQE